MKRILYLGIEIPPHFQNEMTVHCPLIQTIPRSKDDLAINQAFNSFKEYTHIIFTSRNGVSTFFSLLKNFPISKQEISQKMLISVGKRTAEKLKDYDVSPDLIASEETAEGIVKELSKLDLKKAHIFLPQSSLARGVIADWLKENEIKYTACSIYDTLSYSPEQIPDLNTFDEIVFTSPSVVNAFVQIFGSIPMNKTLTCIGPVTQKAINDIYRT